MSVDDRLQSQFAEMPRQRQLQREETEPLPGGRGGGTSPPMANDDLKTRVDWLYTLVPWLIGLLVTLFIAIIVGAATTNGRIDTVGTSISGRTDKLTETVGSLNREVGTLSEKQSEINRRLDRIESKIDKLK